MGKFLFNPITGQLDQSGGGEVSGFEVKTSNYTALTNEKVAADTTSAAWTLTLPATPSNGDTITVLDYAGTFDTNNLTIARNGSNIESLAENMDCNIEDAAFSLVFVGSTVGWKVVPYFGSVTDLTGYATTAQLTNIQIFNASGTWTKPAGAKAVHVELVGGGGGGGGGRRGATSTARGGGGGGAGAGRTVLWLHPDQLGATQTVTVGVGGTAGAAAGNDTNGGTGGNGGDTIFGPLTAFGGNGGNGGNATAVATGGAAAANRGFVLTTANNTLAGGNGGYEGSSAGAGGNAGGGGGTQPAGGGGGSRITATNTLSSSGLGGALVAGSGGINPYVIFGGALPAAGGKGIVGDRLGFFAAGASGGRQGNAGEGAEGGDAILGGGGGGGAGATNDAGGSNAGGLGGNGIAVITTYF
jgi:hypothetical protein